MNTDWSFPVWKRLLQIWGIHFNIEKTLEEVDVLEKSTAEPDFYSDMEKAGKVLQKIKQKIYKLALDKYIAKW